jgi:hypothetical protein
VAGELIPLWIKILYTPILCVLVPVYWVHWGPKKPLYLRALSLFHVGLRLSGGGHGGVVIAPRCRVVSHEEKNLTRLEGMPCRRH